MKVSKLLILVCIITLNIAFAQENKDNTTTILDIEGPYLGQEPPGLIPKAFAPKIVTTDGWECCGVFTPDLKEYYYLREVFDGEGKGKMQLVVIQNKNNAWHKSVVSPRTGTPFISPDGKTMHFGGRYKERTKTGAWSEIKKLGANFEDWPIMRLTASANGTYYFDEFKKDVTGDIRYSRIVNGKHEKPKLLNKKINRGKSFHPFIAPDESYLIFDGEREGGYGESDIYISFRADDGDWGEPINLGDKINTEADEACASVTPDGKYLFFYRNMGSKNYENVDIYWVDAKIIETLKHH